MFICETNSIGPDSYGRTAEDRHNAIGEANVMDNRQQEMDSRIFRSWVFDYITIYRLAYLVDKGIRYYEEPGYGSQDNAFRFLSIAKGIPAISIDVEFNKELYVLKERFTDTGVTMDVCAEFRFLREKLQEDQKLWWKMRLIYWPMSFS